jgi:hypothetical protein
MNCIALLSYARSSPWGEGFDEARKDITEFVGHWHSTAAETAAAK